MHVPGFLLALFAASAACAQVVSFDTRRCESGEFRQLGDGYAAFCDGYQNGDNVCRVWSGAAKLGDACLSGALMRSQQGIRDHTTPSRPANVAVAKANPPPRPSPEVCRQTMLDKIGVAQVDELRPVLAARFAEIVVGTIPGSTNMRLDARRSACDDSRIASVFYDFDAAGVLREITFVWTRPPGPSPAPIFTERVHALMRLHGLPAAQSSSRLEARTSNAKIVVQDIADKNVLVEAYSR
jgi:hypothetical protein